MLLKLVRSTPLYAWAFNLRAWTLTGVSCSLDDALLWNDSQQALNRFFYKLSISILNFWQCEEFKLSFCGFRTTGYQSSSPYLAMNCPSFCTDPPPPNMSLWARPFYTCSKCWGTLKRIGELSYSPDFGWEPFQIPSTKLPKIASVRGPQ